MGLWAEPLINRGNRIAMKHNPEQVKLDTANAKKRICPETLRVVAKGGALAHVAEVFPRYMTADPNSDYARRARLVLAMDDTPEET